MPRRPFLPAIACLTTAFSVVAQRDAARTQFRVEHDLQYAEGFARDGRRNALDIYLPEVEGRSPLVVFVHGGTWSAGSKERHGFIGESLATQGLAAAVINTRMSPFVEPCEMVEDCARAIGWLHRHADEHGYDGDRIVLMGHSSGGHLVSWLGLDETKWKVSEAPRSALRGVVSLSGVYDVRPRHRLLDAVFGPDAEERATASPMRYVDGSAPPFMVCWADRDMAGLGLSARTFGYHLRHAGVAVTLRELAGHNHVDYVWQMRDEASTEMLEVARFVRQVAFEPTASKARGPHETAAATAGARLLAGTATTLPVELYAPPAPGAQRWLALAVTADERPAGRALAAQLCARGGAVALIDCSTLGASDLRDPDRAARFEATVRGLAAAGPAHHLPPAAPVLGAIGACGWLIAAAATSPSGRILLGATAAASVSRGVLHGGRDLPERTRSTLVQQTRIPLLVVTSQGDPETDLGDVRLLQQALARGGTDTVQLTGSPILAALQQLHADDDLLLPVVAAFLGL